MDGAGLQPHHGARSGRTAGLPDQSFGLNYGSRVHFHFDDQAGAVLDVREWLAEQHSGQHVYCCGPQALMQAVQVHAAHLPAQTVHFEYFAAPSVPDAVVAAATAFRVDLRRSGLSLSVPAGRSALEVLEANGVKVPSRALSPVLILDL